MQTNEPTQNKYDEALSKYPTRLDDAAIAAEVAALIDRKREEYNTPDVKKFLFHCIALTTLRCDDNHESRMRSPHNSNRTHEQSPSRNPRPATPLCPPFSHPLPTPPAL